MLDRESDQPINGSLKLPNEFVVGNFALLSRSLTFQTHGSLNNSFIVWIEKPFLLQFSHHKRENPGGKVL
jgi:hypothetical protein